MDFTRLTLLAVLHIGASGCATSDGLQSDMERAQEACNDTFWDRLFSDRDAEEQVLQLADDFLDKVTQYVFLLK